MSCEIKVLANVVDLNLVRSHFGLSSDDKWLDAVNYSLSPTGEIFTFAHAEKIVILGTKWDNSRDHNIFKILWKGEIDNPNLLITSVLSIPVVAQSTSTQSSADWTCLIVGLDNGYVYFYTDSGLLLYTQQFHAEPVRSIKGQSGKNTNEEIHISYSSCVCIVQGSQIFPFLRSFKLKNSKLNAVKSTDLSPGIETVPFKKWGFDDKYGSINDSVVVGPQKTCAFDHLLTASLEGGFYAKYRNAPPQNAIVLAVGSKPYIGFHHYAKETYDQSVIADVARVVASKLKSALPSWLRGGSSSQQSSELPELPPPIPAEPMVCRFGLIDKQRLAFQIWLAPSDHAHLAVVSDNLGRVILVDCIKGIALRVWKGYREAQCSFIEVTEKLPKTFEQMAKRKALFLVLYAPRKSLIEIWSLQNGPKVASFSASKNGLLLYHPYSLMGASSNSKLKYTNNTCIYFDSENQLLKEIKVPFHCALTDSNSKTAKDLHLLKRLKLCLKSYDCTDEKQNEQVVTEVLETCQKFETCEIKIKCLEMLAGNRKTTPIIFQTSLSCLMDESNDEVVQEDEILSLRKLQLNAFASNYYKLVHFYTLIDCEIDMDPEHVRNLNLTESELLTIQKLLELTSEYKKLPTNKVARVTFNDTDIKNNAFIDYLSIFNATQNDTISLKEEKNHVDSYHQIGDTIFSRYFKSMKSTKYFAELAKPSSISSDDFFKLFLHYWLKQPFIYINMEEVMNDLTTFREILESICILADTNVFYDNSSICSWWQNIREALLESPFALRGLLAAIVCRNVAFKYQIKNEEDDDIHDTSKWEEVSQEMCQWSLLIGKLEDVAVLHAILSSTIKCENSSLVSLPFYENPETSLKLILNGGKGVISELVAKWLVCTGLDPKYYFTIIEEDEKENIDKNVVLIIYYLDVLRQHFPFSLESGAILCQLTWEYMCYWSKHLSDLEYLESALIILDAMERPHYAIKHGLNCMLWNAHIKIPLESTKKLMNKAGRLPKEKLCLQDIGMSDALIPQFLDNCLKFIDHFLTSIVHDKVELKYEELLPDGPIPLTLLTIQQNIAIPELLQLHSELTMVLQMIAHFNLKYSKPIQTLFDGMANQTFFCEINRKLNYTLPKSDMIINKLRIGFLEKIITSTMDLIREDFETVFLTDHINWMERIEKLSDIWELDFQKLKKFQVVELYSHGWDSFAEAVLEDIIDLQSIGVSLLHVAGRRLNLYAENKPKVLSEIATIGPQLTDFLYSLKTSEAGPQIRQVVSEISLEDLITLSGKSFKCLSNINNRELRTAGLLFDACCTIKEIL